MTELDKLSVEDFTAELGSGSPAPGGGSAAALAGALACSLVSMVAKVTLNKLEDEGIRDKLDNMATESEQTRAQFLKLINSDTLAFNEIMKSYKLPKTTDFEKDARYTAIQAATKHAAKVPLNTAQLGVKALGWVEELTEVGSENAITDTGVAGLMAYTAVTGAIWNVKINLGSIKDTTFVQKTNEEMNRILSSLSEHWLTIHC